VIILKQTRTGPKYPIVVLSVLLVIGGLYLMFLYEVPDGQEVTNMWASYFLIILGAAGSVVALLWKEKRNPFAQSSRKIG
jgi:hypothetical protein